MPKEKRLNPSAAEFSTALLDERSLDTIAKTLTSMVDERDELRRGEEDRRVDTILGDIAERDDKLREEMAAKEDERNNTLAALVRALTESNDRAAEATRRAEESRRKQARELAEEQERRWQEEKERREKLDFLKAIPPPPAMARDQDLADYLELFTDNIMDSREIPKPARAKHLLPLLNSKATTAISGLPAEAKMDIDVLMSTLLSTVYETTKFTSKAYWQHTKQGGDSARTTMTKLLRLARRFAVAESVDKVIEIFTIEKFLQLYPSEVQAYCREKGLTDAYKVADLAANYLTLKDVDEVRYDSTKPWTYKSKEERGEEKRQGNYWCHKTKYKQDFKQGANNQHPIVKSHQDSQDGRNAKQGSADAHIKQEKKDEGKPSGETNTNLSDNGAYKDFMANRRWYYCGKRGHLAKDCYKKRNVNVARVPSLAQVSGEALTVSGSIGEVEVPQMLCDSGATISVISEDLVPAGVTLSEEVWVGTVGVEPKPYPTVLVPATVNGKQLELFAAVVPADRMTCPVILGRYIPGKKVS